MRLHVMQAEAYKGRNLEIKYRRKDENRIILKKYFNRKLLSLSTLKNVFKIANYSQILRFREKHNRSTKTY